MVKEIDNCKKNNDPNNDIVHKKFLLLGLNVAGKLA
jgi:hypothetical protein